MTRIFTIAGFLIACSSYARSEVCLWSVTPGGSATITVEDIRIDAAGTYKFEAVATCEMSTTLGNIGNITINDSVTGTVNVYIESRANNNTNGAVNVGSIKLTNNNITPVVGNLLELRIEGDLGTLGPVVVRTPDNSIIVVDGDVVDSVTINGDLDGDITATSMETVTVNGSVSSGDSIVARSSETSRLMAISPEPGR